jgi:exosortase
VESITSFAVGKEGVGAPVEKQLWRQRGVHNYIKILVIGGLFCYLFRGEFRVLMQDWLADSSWSHGFLIPLFSLYFINQHKREILNIQARPNYLGLVFLVCGILFYFFNLVSPSGYAYFRSLSILVSLGSIVLFLGGWRLVKYTWLPIVFLVFAVPLPDRTYKAISMPMRIWVAKAAAFFLSMVGDIEATARGAIIDVVYRGKAIEPPLDVAEACSGMRLLMAFLALGVAMAYLHYRPLWQRFILLASTIPIAIFCNFVRVTVTGFIYVLIHPRYTQGIYHDGLGIAMLPLAFALYSFLGWFMSSLFIEESEAVAEDVVVRKRNA